MNFPLWRRRQKDELDEEIRSHLESAVRERMERGEPRAQAEAAARREFGNPELVAETTRDMWGWASFDRLAQDVRYGLRQLRHNPGFTLTAVLTLALGIGANTAIFSFVNALVLRPLPISQPDKLVALSNTARNRPFPTFSYPNYRDLRDRNDVLSHLLAFRFVPMSVSYAGANHRIWGHLVSGNYFEALGLQAVHGRLLSPNDDDVPGAHPVAVLSYEAWQTRFGGETGMVGQDVIINGRSYTVVGVAPRGFFGTTVGTAPEVWIPVAMQASIEAGINWLDRRGAELVFLQGILKPGVTPAQARASLNGLAAELEREFPDENADLKIEVSPAGMLGTGGRAANLAGLLMLAVGLVLLLACANLANLLLARGTERRAELAVRMALGASRARLVRQLLTESLLLATAGGLLALLPLLWPVNLRVVLRPPIDLPIQLGLGLDYRVLLFTGLLIVASGLLFGLMPALQATRSAPMTNLKEGAGLSAPRSMRLRSSLIVLQVALSLVLLVAGGLVLRSLQLAQQLELGFTPQGAIEASFDLRMQGYSDAQGREFQRQILERVRNAPGIQSVAIADMVPIDLHFPRASVFIEGQAPEREQSAPHVLTSRVSPGYFAAVGTRLLQGRDFNQFDSDTGARVAIVNLAFAQRFWPGQNPIGRHFSLGSPDSPQMEVVGIVQDGKYASLFEDPKPFVYRSLWQSYTGTVNLVARGDIPADRMIERVRREFVALDPHLPLAGAAPLADRMGIALLPARAIAAVFGSFGLLGLALAAVGIYGVVSYAVSRRTHEIGVRMALGARKSDVLRLVLGQEMRWTLLGMALGLPLAISLARAMKNLLVGASATDPLTYASVIGVLFAVAALASLAPARRAARVDPATALRHE